MSGAAIERTPGPHTSYIPHTGDERQQMLRVVGVPTIDHLFSDIPPGLLNPSLDLPPPLTEMELMSEMKVLAGKNRGMISFLGAGAYRRYQPEIVRTITSRGEFLTSYTPYQPEISQGTLQTAFEFQSMIRNLYGMEVSNTGMYDGATAMAEAALMAVRVQSEIKKSPDKNRIVMLDSVHPNWRDVSRTYLRGKNIELDIADPDNLAERMKGAAAVVVQSPNYLGGIEDLEQMGKDVHEAGGLFIVASDPISLGMLKSPGEVGADIAVGEGQSLGNPIHFGGVNLGIFTAREKYVRQMPGRIVGQTTDEQDRTGYVLTLQAREQHIRRETATSNICTAEQLIALASTVYLAALGDKGLEAVAKLNYQKAHYLASKMAEIPGFKLSDPDGHFFNEFVVECPEPPSDINMRLLGEGIIGGKDVSDRVPNGMLVCATETTTKEEIDRFVAALAA